jgi:hypothetical protein
MSIEITPAARAAVIASQVAGQLNSTANNVSRLLSQGIPAQGNNPAVSADEITASLGSIAVAQANLIVAAANTTDAGKLASALAALA